MGFRTYFLLVPEKSIAVVTMGNSDTFPSDNVAFAALDILLGEEPEKPRQWIVVPVSRMMAKKGVKAAVELYHQLKKETFDDYLFREVFLNRLGYALMRENRFDDAVEIFKLNVSEYPDSWNVYDSLGEAYFKKGDKAMAIKNYQKAVELNPRESGREKQNYANQVEILKKLKEDK